MYPTIEYIIRRQDGLYITGIDYTPMIQVSVPRGKRKYVTKINKVDSERKTAKVFHVTGRNPHAYLDDLEEALTEYIGMKVTINKIAR